MAQGDLAYPDFTPKPHHRLLDDSTTFTNAQVITKIIPTHGHRYLTLRCLTTTTGGTFALAFLRPNGVAYTTGNPTGVTQVAGTENSSGEITLNGQAWLQVTFTAGAGSGTINYCDVYML